MESARGFVKKHIYNSEFLEGLSDIDFKSKLLKYSQKEKVKIEYKVEKKEGLEHQKEFLVAVFINGKKKADARASSKKEAEQNAAKKIINNLF
jgi:ribonuclease-3